MPSDPRRRNFRTTPQPVLFGLGKGLEMLGALMFDAFEQDKAAKEAKKAENKQAIEQDRGAFDQVGLNIAGAQSEAGLRAAENQIDLLAPERDVGQGTRMVDMGGGRPQGAINLFPEGTASVRARSEGRQVTPDEATRASQQGSQRSALLGMSDARRQEIMADLERRAGQADAASLGALGEGADPGIVDLANPGAAERNPEIASRQQGLAASSRTEAERVQAEEDNLRRLRTIAAEQGIEINRMNIEEAKAAAGTADASDWQVYRSGVLSNGGMQDNLSPKGLRYVLANPDASFEDMGIDMFNNGAAGKASSQAVLAIARTMMEGKLDVAEYARDPLNPPSAVLTPTEWDNLVEVGNQLEEIGRMFGGGEDGGAAEPPPRRYSQEALTRFAQDPETTEADINTLAPDQQEIVRRLRSGGN